MAAIVTLLDELLHPGDVFEKYPTVSKIYNLFAMAIHPDYRGQGLAKSLVKQSLIVAEKADCNALMVLAVSDYASKIFFDMGMEIIAEKEWKDCIFDGVRPFGNVESKKATGYFMKINNKT